MSVSYIRLGTEDQRGFGVLWTKRAKIASGRIVALELWSKTEKNGGVDDGNKQDRYEGGDQLRKGGRILGARGRGACLELRSAVNRETAVV